MEILVDPKRCHDNPCIRSRIARDPVKFANLRTSIRESGILQAPHARKHPSIEGDFEIQFGEGRRDAWILEYPGKPIKIVVENLSDEEMRIGALRENLDRDDLSIMEIARSMQQYQKATGCNQARLAAVYHYKDQPSVSNVLALLRLPDAVQMMVHRGELPQRHARALVPFAKMAPAEVKN